MDSPGRKSSASTRMKHFSSMPLYNNMMIVASAGTGLQNRTSSPRQNGRMKGSKQHSNNNGMATSIYTKKSSSFLNSSPYMTDAVQSTSSTLDGEGIPQHYDTSRLALVGKADGGSASYSNNNQLVDLQSLPEYHGEAVHPHYFTSASTRTFEPPHHAPPSLPLTTPLPPRASKRQFPHANAVPILPMTTVDPGPQPEELERYEASYNVIVKRMLSSAPADLKDELSSVVAIILCRCRELEDKVIAQEKKMVSLSKEKKDLNLRAEQLNKLLASSKSFAKAMTNKARELESEVTFQYTTVNKQTEAMNKLSDKNRKLASAISKLGSEGREDFASLIRTTMSMTAASVESSHSSGTSRTRKRFDGMGGDEVVTRALQAKKEVMLTVAALTKENLQWTTRSKLLEKDTHLFRDQLRILNEKLRQIHVELEEAKSTRSPVNREALQRLTLEALALDPDNNIKLQTIQSRKFSISELLEGEEDPLGKIIGDPSIDSVIVLIQMRNLVKLISKLSESTCQKDLLQGLLSRATCKILGCEDLGLYVAEDDDETMWYMTTSQPNKKLYSTIGNGLAGAALAEGEMLKTNDPFRQPNFNAHVDGCASLTPRNILSIPIKLDGKPIALLQLVNKMTQGGGGVGSRGGVGKEGGGAVGGGGGRQGGGGGAAAAAAAVSMGGSFNGVDALFAKMLLTQTMTIFHNCQETALTEMQLEACFKYLLVPANYLKPLVADVLFPTREIDPLQQIVWTMKRLQVLVEQTLNVKRAKVFVVDRKKASLWCLQDSAEPQHHTRRIFSTTLGLCGRMAASIGKITVIDPQKDYRVNTDVDLDTGEDPLHSCSIRAISGQIMAIIQVGSSSVEIFKSKYLSLASPSTTSLRGTSKSNSVVEKPLTTLTLLNALEFVCEQIAPYLETVLQVLFGKELDLSTYQPRIGSREAMAKADTDAVMQDLEKAQERAERATVQAEELSKQVSELEAIKDELTWKVTETTHQLQMSQEEVSEEKKKLLQTEEQMKTLQHSLDQALEGQTTLKAEIIQLQKKARRASINKQSDQEIKTLKEKVVEAQKAQEQSMIEMAKICSELKASLEEKRRLTQDLEALRKSHEEVANLYQTLKEEFSQQPTKQQLDQLTEELAHMSKAKEELEVAYQTMKTEHDQRPTLEQRRRLLADLEEMTKEKEELAVAYGKLKVEHEQVQASLVNNAQASNVDVDILIKKVATLEAENIMTHDTARKEAQKMRDELEAIMKDVEVYEADLTEKESLQREVETLKEKIATLVQEQQQQQQQQQHEEREEQQEPPSSIVNQAQQEEEQQPQGQEQEPKQTDGAAAAEWDEYQDEEGHIYYMNRVTGETAWERPGGEQGQYTDYIYTTATRTDYQDQLAVPGREEERRPSQGKISPPPKSSLVPPAGEGSHYRIDI